MNPVDDPERYHKIGSEDWFTNLYVVDRTGEHNDEEFPFKLEDWSGNDDLGPNNSMRIHKDEVVPLIETLADVHGEIPSPLMAFVLGFMLGASV